MMIPQRQGTISLILTRLLVYFAITVVDPAHVRSDNNNQKETLQTSRAEELGEKTARVTDVQKIVN
jgi:hypothetical protein